MFLGARNWIVEDPVEVLVDSVPLYVSLAPKFQELRKGGATVTAIAAAHGKTSQWVQQVLDFADTGIRPKWHKKAQKRRRDRGSKNDVPAKGPKRICGEAIGRAALGNRPSQPRWPQFGKRGRSGAEQYPQRDRLGCTAPSDHNVATAGERQALKDLARRLREVIATKNHYRLQFAERMLAMDTVKQLEALAAGDEGPGTAKTAAKAGLPGVG